MLALAPRLSANFWRWTPLPAGCQRAGVDVVIVRPGFVRTKMTAGMTPAPFAVGPDDVARAIESGVRARRAVVWVPSTLRPVFLVLRALPRRMWRRIPMGIR